MSMRRHTRLGAFLALVLLLTGTLLPAFGAPGRWVCADGRVCDRMKASSMDRMPDPSQTGKPAGEGSPAAPAPCCRKHPKHDCPMEGSPRAILKTPKAPSPSPCRFVPTVPEEGNVRLAPTRTFTESPLAALLLPPSLTDLAASFREPRPVHPLPSDTDLSPPPFLALALSRGPPLG